jgi:esterase/lipase
VTKLTVYINDKKTESAVKAVLDTFNLNYTIVQSAHDKPMNKSEQQIYNRLKRSIKEINLYKEGKITLRDAKSFVNKL